MSETVSDSPSDPGNAIELVGIKYDAVRVGSRLYYGPNANEEARKDPYYFLTPEGAEEFHRRNAEYLKSLGWVPPPPPPPPLTEDRVREIVREELAASQPRVDAARQRGVD